jgi:hypothetical protein
MGLEHIIMNETRRSQRKTNVSSHLYEAPRIVNLMETEDWTVVP